MQYPCCMRQDGYISFIRQTPLIPGLCHCLTRVCKTTSPSLPKQTAYLGQKSWIIRNLKLENYRELAPCIFIKYLSKHFSLPICYMIVVCKLVQSVHKKRISIYPSIIHPSQIKCIVYNMYIHIKCVCVYTYTHIL